MHTLFAVLASVARRLPHRYAPRNQLFIRLCCVLLLALYGLTACSTIDAERHEIPALDQQVSTQRLPICYNHGCTVVRHIAVSETTWTRVENVFANIGNDFEERLAIRQAIALFEQEAALHTPVGIDLPKNTNEDDHGRQDCLDESTNTTHFLLLLQTNHLLQWHEVTSRVYRAHFAIDQHYAAQIKQRFSGQRYVVDSWFLANGALPYIQTFRDWAYKKPFLAKDNPASDL